MGALLVLQVTLQGCSSSNAVRLTPDTDIAISEVGADGKTDQQVVQANQVFELKGEAAMLTAPGKIPVFLIDPASVKFTEERPIRISLKSVEEWKPVQTDAFITRKMDDLYVEIFEVLQLARSKKTELALLRVEKIIETYPKLASAYYVRGQIEYIMGNRKKAMTSLEVAIQLRPEFTDAIQLQKRIESDSKRGNS